MLSQQNFITISRDTGPKIERERINVPSPDLKSPLIIFMTLVLAVYSFAIQPYNSMIQLPLEVREDG